jgi:protein disulfide-isomerase
MNSSWKPIVAIVFALAAAIPAWAQDIEWQTDLPTAVRLATEQNKFVLMHFTAVWCRPCQNLNTYVFSSAAVTRAINQYTVPVKVDIDYHPDLVKQYGISGIPSDVCITPSGRVVSKRNSPSTADDYIRMIESLQVVDSAIEHGNVALSQNIDQIAAMTKPKPDAQKFLNPNKFQVEAPAADFPEPATSSKILEQQTPMETKQMFAASESASKQPATQTAPGQTPAGGGLELTNRSASPGPGPSTNSTAALVSTPSSNGDENGLISRPAAKVENGFICESNNGQAVESSSSHATLQIATQQPERATPAMKYALHGKCPVTLINEGRWIDGDSQFGCVHRGKVYLFRSAAELETFRANPDAFSPLLAGYDPVEYVEQGALIDGHEKFGVFMGRSPNQRVILFRSQDNKERFQQEPRKYLSEVQLALQSTDAGTIMR